MKQDPPLADQNMDSWNKIYHWLIKIQIHETRSTIGWSKYGFMKQDPPLADQNTDSWNKIHHWLIKIQIHETRSTIGWSKYRFMKQDLPLADQLNIYNYIVQTLNMRHNKSFHYDSWLQIQKYSTYSNIYLFTSIYKINYIKGANIESCESRHQLKSDE